MKKKMTSVLAVYAIVLIMYSVVFFVIPFEKTATMWATYIFAVLALIAGPGIVLLAFQKGETLKSKVYGFPILRLGVLYAVIQLVFSIIVCLINSFVDVPVWIVIVISILGMGCVAIGLIAADNTRDVIEQQEAETEQQIKTSKQFRIDIDGIVDLCEDDKVKAQLMKLSEEIRYSDPISAPELEELEAKILDELEQLREIVADDAETAILKTKKIAGLVADRNRRCKLLK